MTEMSTYIIYYEILKMTIVSLQYQGFPLCQVCFKKIIDMEYFHKHINSKKHKKVAAHYRRRATELFAIHGTSG